MKALFFIDGLVFRLLRAIIRLIDAVVPFSAKYLARILLGIFVLGDFGRFLTHFSYRFSIGMTLLMVILIVPRIERLGTRGTGTEHNPMQCVLRLFVIVLFGFSCALDLLIKDRLDLLCNTTFPLLIYVLDMDFEEPGERRRVLDAVRESVSRPGYSTAGSEA